MFLVGDTTDGAIRSGIVAHIPMDDRPHLRVPIMGVEFADYPGGVAHLALWVEIDDAEEERIVEANCKEGVTLTVVEASAPARDPRLAPPEPD